MEGTRSQSEYLNKKTIKNKKDKTKETFNSHLHSKSYKDVRGYSIPVIQSD